MLGGQDLPVTREVTLTITEGTALAAAASPDRRWIAMDLLGSIWVLPFHGGTATKITPDLLEARQPTWSPDSEAIAFQGYDDGAWHVYVISREGENLKAITRGVFDDREPAWSHDGLRIAFSSDRAGGIVSPWQVVVESGEAAQVTAHDGWMPSWAPNDRELTFVSPDRVRGAAPVPGGQSAPGLWGVDANGREAVIVPAERGMMPEAAAWSSSGKQVAYVRDAALYVGENQITKDEDVFPFRPQWLTSTDILYTANGHIRRRSLVFDTATDIPFKATVTLRRATYTITHRPLDATQAQQVGGIVAPAVAPSGGAIAFVALGDVWVLPQGGRAVRVTDDEAVELDPAWSPDGSQLAFSSDRSGSMQLWLHDFRTSDDRQLTRLPGGRVSGAAWSPDGSQIAFLVGRRDLRTVQLRRTDCVGGGEISAARRELGRPTWAPDCNAVAVGALFPYSDRFREGLNQLLVYNFEFKRWFSSVLFPDHSAGNRQTSGPAWSPNGLQMAFVSEGHLWTVDVDRRGAPTAPPRSIAGDEDGADSPSFPSWEGDSRRLVYLTPHGFQRVLADGSPSSRIPMELLWKAAAPPSRTIVHAGHVFEGTVDGLRGETDIVVEHGFVSEITGHDPQLHTATVAVVDASDEVVIPGLIEMHAHLDRDYGSDFGRVWLAYGVTSVRVPAVDPYEGLEMRESFDAGKRPGPRVFIAGDPFDGVRVYYPGGVSIASGEQLERELDRARALDIDFFKTYVRLPDRFQRRVIEYAHAYGRPVTSHELFPAVAFGIDGIEHLRGTSRRGYSTKMSGANVAYRDVIDLIAKSGVTLTPTIGIEGAFEERVTGDKSLLSDRRFALYPNDVVLRLADLASRRPDVRLDRGRRVVRSYEAMLKAIAAAGGTIVAGTDSPIVPYGLGLHVELESYVHAGLTPFEALQTATVNAAQALGLGDELGTIQAGKRADLTFLSADPLLDIRNTREVTRVMRSGRVYTVDDLVKQQ